MGALVDYTDMDCNPFLSSGAKEFIRICRQRKTWNCHRRGGAAISEFRGGLSSPPAAAKTVRTISRIDHQNQNSLYSEFW